MPTGSNDDTAGRADATTPGAASPGDATSETHPTGRDTQRRDSHGQDVVDGVLVATQAASLVTAIVAFALRFDDSTRIAIPGGTISALAAGYWLVALAATAAAAKAHHRDARTRALGHATIAIGVTLLALTGGLVLLDLGTLLLTGGTVGVLIAIAGANLVLYDLLV